MKYLIEVTTEETVWTRRFVTVDALSESEAASRALALVDDEDAGDPGQWVHSEHADTEVTRIQLLDGGAS